MKFFKRYDRLFLLLVQCIGILIILQFNECGCFSKKRGDSRDGSIVMEIPSAPLVGDQRTVDITFKLENPNMTADLSNFTLEIAVRKQLGEGGSEISYSYKGVNTVKKTPPVVEVLSEVSPVSILTPANPSCKVALTFVPTHKTTELELELRLRNKSDEVLNDGTTLWKAAPKEAEIIVTRISPQDMKASDKTIKIGIENTGGADAEEGKTRLKIKRKEGSSAMIVGSTMTVKGEVYTLDLPFIGAGNKLTHELIIDPQEDSKVTFSIQPQYNNTDIQTPFIVKWERGAAVEVLSAVYDSKNNVMRIKVKNPGTETLTGGKVTAEMTTPGAQFEGNTRQEIQLQGPLKPGQTQEIEHPTTLNFGQNSSGTENISGLCRLTACPTGCPMAPKVVVEKVLTKAFIVLSLDVQPSEDRTKVNLTIQNTGRDTAKGLQLKYANISSDADGKLVTLDDRPKNVMTLPDLIQDQEFKHTFELAFNDADAAKFDFKIIYDDQAIEEKEETFENKPLDLSLDVLVPSANNTSSYILYGAENELVFGINQKSGSRDVKLENLWLSIKTDAGTVSKAIDEPAIDKVVGHDLGNLGNNLKLYVKPKSEVKEADFSFQLKYKDKDVGTPVRIEWREYPLMITNVGRLVGDQVGTFEVYSTVPLDLNAIKIILKGDDKTTFQFIKEGYNDSTSATLAQVAGYYQDASNVVHKNRTIPIEFKVNETGKQKESKLNIILIHGTTEIARQDVDWVDRGVGVAIELGRSYSFDNGKALLMTVQNTTGQDLDLHKVKFKLTNTENIPFILGSHSGAEIVRSIAEIKGTHTLGTGEETEIEIRPSVLLGDKLVTGLKLAVLDKEDNIISQAYGIYLGGPLMLSEDIMPMIVKAEGKAIFGQEIEKIKDDLNSLAHFQLILRKLRVAYTDLIKKLEEIKINNSDFAPVINMLVTTEFSDWLKKLEVFEQDTKKAILDLTNKENVILEWVTKVQREVDAIKDRIENSPEEIEKLDNIAEINNFLIGTPGGTDKGDIHKQSVIALAINYMNKVKEAETLLVGRGIEKFEGKFEPVTAEDTESIRQLKQMYQQMFEYRLTLLRKIQQTFDIGFKKFVDIIIKQQQDFEAPTKKTDPTTKASLFKSLTDQKSALDEWLNFLKYRSEAVADIDAKLVTLAECYQRLAENNLKFAKGVFSKRKKGPVLEAGKLAIGVAKDAFTVAQSNKVPSVQEAVIKTYKFAIKTHKKAEIARNAQGNWRKSQVVVEDGTKRSKLSTTVLQDLDSDLKGLKAEYKEYKKASRKS